MIMAHGFKIDNAYIMAQYSAGQDRSSVKLVH